MTNQKNLSDLCKIGQCDDKTEKEFWEMLSFLAPKECESFFEQVKLTKEPIYMREDKAEKSLDKREVLALAPMNENGYIRIPKVMEDT